MIGIAEDSVRFAHSGPFHRFLRPADAELVSGGPFPLPVSGGGHASATPTILPPENTTQNIAILQTIKGIAVIGIRMLQSVPILLTIIRNRDNPYESTEIRQKCCIFHAFETQKSALQGAERTIFKIIL